MASYYLGKIDVCGWIRKHFPEDSTVLDVGACDGEWRRRLQEYENMDAVEIFIPNAEKLVGVYRDLFVGDISDYEYDWYDLIIFGDVIEHMTVERAQSVLAYARSRCRDMVVAVPFQYEQGAIYGNEWERHIQPDLTHKTFDERYTGFEPIWDSPVYCYYHKSGG